jgi:DNA-binding NarL/FixJ family response regulator
VTPPPSVLIAHGDPTIRAGLARALARAGFAIAPEVADGAAAVAAAAATPPDVVLVAADLPDGMAVVRALAAAPPMTKVVVISARPDGEELLRAVLAGACGYLGADMKLERLPATLHGLLAGEVALPRDHTARLLEELRLRHAGRALIAARTGARLSAREWDVLGLLARDASTAVMARELGITEVTVRRHVSMLLAKLGVGTRAEAAALVRRSTA